MAHECEYCGMWCYCDMDDCGGLPQPINCRHFTQKDYCLADRDIDYDDDWRTADD